jgi:hypothetical protein
MIIVKRVLAIIVILAIFASGATFFTNSRVATAQDGEYESFTSELAKQLEEIYQQKQALTPVQRKIDSSILRVIRKIHETTLADEARELESLSTPLLKIDNSGNLEIKLTVSTQTAEQLEQLEDLGMNVRLTLPKYGIVEGTLPYDRVETVAGLDFVLNVGTPGYALHNTGGVNSEGDAVLRAAEARTAFGVDGSGIKVGVMSDGVSHLADSQATGDLPSTVDVLKAGSGNEGTAMLEIIHDLAPGASLAFYSPDTSSDMVAGIDALETAGCDIIVDDLTYLNEPKFENGPIAQEARQFVTNGGVYVTSAGNHAQDHYTATYSPDGVVHDDYSSAHDYGSGDIGNTFSVPNGGEIVAILQWNNQWGSSGDDFDLFLARSSDNYVLNASTEWQTGTGNPWEGLVWINDTGSSVTVYIAVLEYDLVNSPSSLILDYYVYYDHSGLEYITPSNSVIGHAAVEEVLSTAAANAATPDTIEYFSSQGPGTIYFPTYEDRQVPNIAGVDGVQTKTGQLGYFSNPFYGTSASAPHVAAIVALVWEADPTLTPSEVRNAITSTAADRPPAGYDYTWGFGLADAYEAVYSVYGGANTPPVLSNGQVNPDAGYITTDFTYSVTYTDADNDPPASPTVSIDGGGPIDMTEVDSGDTDYTDGKDYEYTTGGLDRGSHTFQFAASDGFDAATGDTGVHNGPGVENTAPVLSAGQVSPDPGYVTTDFTYSVIYTDADNDPPASPTVSIDGGGSIDMTEVDPGDTDYTDGKDYQYTTSGLAKDIAHTYQFAASDSVDNATGDTGSHNGPTVQNSPPTAPVVNVTPDSPVTTDDLICTITTSSIDPDVGDIITYTYEWYKDDVLQPGLTTNTVDSTNTAKDDIWKCVVTPNDGTTDGLTDEDQVTIGNSSPNTPGNPSPSNHASGISVNASLSWMGGDPDVADTVTYDVYFGTSATPPLVSTNQTATTYDPGTLAYNTTYYWQIVARDNHGTESTGPLWWFSTGELLLGDANGDGVVDTGDITKIKRIYFEIDDPTPCADANMDDVVDTGDITKVKRIYFELDDPTPCAEAKGMAR